ncbi:hypothetical protein SAMN05216511_0085 [Streptomyces sp. KS_16]|nr:hypothetical protein BX261_7165 [Streptomyces sp. 2321.6]SDQ63808.1 hypothetical protein SAMN05216511_0085 [Streptomyces sp. KS_16]SEE17198.1 hypothetical protein SAMN05428940_7188 [Streptomyces sp. 2133.1]SNC74210.1 hypothetical protein SAMN06272741_7092 [Streptomyces sp. 2114.4]
MNPAHPHATRTVSPTPRPPPTGTTDRAQPAKCHTPLANQTPIAALRRSTVSVPCGAGRAEHHDCHGAACCLSAAVRTAQSLPPAPALRQPLQPAQPAQRPDGQKPCQNPCAGPRRTSLQPVTDRPRPRPSPSPPPRPPSGPSSPRTLPDDRQLSVRDLDTRPSKGVAKREPDAFQVTSGDCREPHPPYRPAHRRRTPHTTVPDQPPAPRTPSGSEQAGGADRGGQSLGHAANAAADSASSEKQDAST